MATDFFARQDNARRQTVRLLVLFAVSVALIIVVIYAVALVILQSGDPHAYGHGRHGAAPLKLWDPGLLAAVTFATLAVIGAGSFYKIAELAAGGQVVAQMMGGRLVNPQTADRNERQLLNIVEEMSIASGVPVPPVYVLDHESSINAFAAGYQPGDAVVAVSRGCLEYLTREELQGVMGHEFSHVLNGDMRLNLRLIGIVSGILTLSIIGYYVMRGAGTSSRSSDSRRGDGRAAVFLIGLALMILGYLGVLLGNLIKAAISRQREFLADASSVQFTRNPGGLCGALKKIGGLAEGSRIRDAHAQEISHMFFGDAFAGSFFNLFATHPPLEQRIRLLDPDFAGEYPDVAPAAVADEIPTAALSAGHAPAVAALASAPGARAPRRPGRAVSTDADRILSQIGSPKPDHLEHAVQISMAVPAKIAQAVREPFDVRGVIAALLLSRDEETVRDRQWQLLRNHADPALLPVIERIIADVDGLPPENRLPLVDTAVPALKRLSAGQYRAFRQIVEALTNVDGKVDLFEYCLRVILFAYLDVYFGLRPAPAVRYKAVNAVAPSVLVVLSALAYAGQNHPNEIQRAFQAGAHDLLGAVHILPPQRCGLDAFDAALGQLAEASPAVKRKVLGAVVACIAADGKMNVAENELLRAIGAALSCPLPPVPVETS